MKHCFVLLIGLGWLCLGALARAELTLEQIAANPKLWPKDVKITQATPIQLYQNGQPGGTMQANVGLTVRVARVEAGRVVILLGSSAGAVPAGATDVLARAAALAASAPAAPATLAPTSTVEPPAAASAANPKPAARFENFHSGWRMPKGKWVIKSDTEIEQHDNKDTVSNASNAIAQSGKMEYRLKELYYGGKSACTTIYIMCDDGDKLERGNGYLIADALNEKGHAEVSIAKVTDNKPKDVKKLASTPVNGQWIDLLITYDANTGVVEITRNGASLGSWTDPDPIKTGKDFSIGTCMTKASFKDIEVRQLQ